VFRMPFLLLTGLICCASLGVGKPCFAQSGEAISGPASAAAVLPSSVILYVEARQPSALVDMLLKHPLRSQLEAMPPFQQAMNSQQMVQLKSAVSIFEAGMGMRWPKVVHDLTDGGIYVALDSQTQGVALLMKSADAKTLEQFRDTILSAVQANRGSPVKEGEYRGLKGYALQGEARMAVINDWLLLSNKTETAKRIIDHFLDGGDETLANKTSFQAAQQARDKTARFWGFSDIETIRNAGLAKPLYSGQTDNPLAELLFGGILSNLQHTTFGTATLKVDQQAIKLSLATPHEAQWASEQREYYFGPDGKGAAPPLIQAENRLFALSAFRGMSEMWLRAGDLMTEKANDQLAKADTQLTTFFSGRDFGEEILGSIDSHIQLVAVRQQFDHILPRPAIKLPAFALQFRMKDPEITQPDLRRVFQSFIGFLNVVGAMQGQPQFDLGMETEDANQMVTATYVPDRDARQATDAAINFNFSPTIAFAGDRLILSSTEPLARQLVSQASPEQSSEPVNTVAQFDANTLQAILRDNRPQLVAQNMLEKGHDQAAAQAEIGLLLDLLSFVKDASLTLQTSEQQLQLEVALELANPQ
jgi:hypothetical protein